MAIITLKANKALISVMSHMRLMAVIAVMDIVKKFQLWLL